MTTYPRHSERVEHEALLEVATPELYRRNAFRVLGISVNVDSAELGRQQKKLRMMEKLGTAAPPSQSGGLLPLDPSPDADTLRQAGQRLHDMQTRLIDEVFWFWPPDASHGPDQAALTQLQRGDIAGAHRAWSAESQDDASGPVVNHNLAVLHHALALDLETAGQWHGTAPKSQADRIDQHWMLALKYWAIVADDEAFWDRVNARAKELDDPRLTSGFVRRLRQSLPQAILAINVGIAVRAARRGDVDEAARHAKYVYDSDFDPDLIDRLWEDASPLLDQIRRICDPISEHSKADPANASQLAERVQNECQPFLDGIRAILSEEHHLREQACDLVAETIRTCMIDYVNETGDWDTCLPFLEQAAELAVDDALRSRLQNDLADVQKAQADGKRLEKLKEAMGEDRVYEVSVTGRQVRLANACTCCLGTADGQQNVGLTWEETRGLTRYQRTISFDFPICKECRRHQSEYVWKRCILILLAAGGSAAIAFMVAGAIEKPEWLHFVLAGGVLTTVLALTLGVVIRLRMLPEQHACRDQPVEMTQASDDHVVFRFHNPLYAEAFAESNDATVTEVRQRKPPRGTYIFAGRGAILSVIIAIILGGIGQSVIYAMMEDSWRQSSSTPSRATESESPHQSGTSLSPGGQNGSSRDQPWLDDPVVSPGRPQYGRDNTNTTLSSRIDAAKLRVRSLESDIQRMDSELDSLTSRLQRYKREVDRYESRVRSGANVNQYQYQQAIDNHNRLVKEYNALLAERNRKHERYEQELESVNDMVKRYNQGKR